MKKYITIASVAFIFFIVVSGMFYCAISFSAMSTNPAKWEGQQRDMFAVFGIVITGIGAVVAGVAFEEMNRIKDKK